MTEICRLVGWGNEGEYHTASVMVSECMNRDMSWVADAVCEEYGSRQGGITKREALRPLTYRSAYPVVQMHTYAFLGRLPHTICLRNHSCDVESGTGDDIQCRLYSCAVATEDVNMYNMAISRYLINECGQSFPSLSLSFLFSRCMIC